MPNVLTRLSKWTNARRKLVWLILFAPGRCRAGDCVDAGLPDHAVQGTNAAHHGNLLHDATLVAVLTHRRVAADAHVGDRIVARGRWWSRIVLVILLLPVLGATWLARQNHFEWMFNPLPNPAYAKAAEVKFVSDDDRVMAVTIGGESVAYPIRLMGYHHLIGDTVGGVPIVATY